MENDGADVYRLSSGLRAVIRKGGGGRSAALGVWLGVGSRHESAEEHGIAHLTEHVVFRGTRGRRSSFEIANAVERVGGELNGETDRDYTGYFAKVPAGHWETALEVLAEMASAPLLRQADVRRERRVVLEESATYLDTPADRVYDVVQDLLWPDQPLGRTGLGTPETLEALGRAELAAFHRRFYAPANAVFSMVGPVEPSEVLEALERRFPAGEREPAPAPEAARDEQEAPRYRLERRDSEETHLCLGVRTFGRSDPDRHALRLLQVVLADGMSSRLFQEVRDRRGLAYDVDAELAFYEETGALLVYVGADRRRAGEAAARVVAELEKFRAAPPEGRELEDAKERCLGGLALHLEDTAAVSHWAGTSLLLEGRAYSYEEVSRTLAAVTASDLERAAARCLRPERMCLAVVGRGVRVAPFESG